MNTLKPILFLSSLFLISSCTIYDNDVEGEAELVYSSTITIRANDFSPIDEFISIADYGWDNLNEETVDYGLVLGYIQFEGSTAWQALPFSIPYENDLVNLRYLFDIDNFSLIIDGEVADNNEANVAIFDRDILRVIAIPPDQIIRAKGFNYRNYHHVIEYYNLD